MVQVVHRSGRVVGIMAFRHWGGGSKAIGTGKTACGVPMVGTWASVTLQHHIVDCPDCVAELAAFLLAEDLA